MPTTELVAWIVFTIFFAPVGLLALAFFINLLMFWIRWPHDKEG